MQTDIKSEGNNIDSIIHINGFIPALCHSLASIAYSDGPVTLNEYSLIVAAANKIATLSDNPALINIFTLQGLLDEKKLNQSLKELTTYQHNISDENKMVILNALLPIINAQHDSVEIIKKFTAILNTSEDDCSLYHRLNIPIVLNLPSHIISIKKQLNDIFWLQDYNFGNINKLR